MENQDLATIIMSQAVLGDPIKYARLLKVTQSEGVEGMRALLPGLKKRLDAYEITNKRAKTFRKQVSGEGYARRRKEGNKIFEGLGKQSENMKMPSVDLSMLLALHFESVTSLFSTIVQGVELVSGSKMYTIDDSIGKWAETLSGNSNELGQDRVDVLLDKADSARKDALQSLAMEQKINSGASTNFLRGLSLLEQVISMYSDYLLNQSRYFEAYYERLRNRHSSGVAIAKLGTEPSVVLTDVCTLVWDNIDKVGEIEDGNGEGEISAFTLHRASAMIEATRSPEVWGWVTSPGDKLLNWAKTSLEIIVAIRQFVISSKKTLGESIWRVVSSEPEQSYKDFEDVVLSLDLSQITQRSPERAFSKLERFSIEHRNNSIQKVASLLTIGADLPSVVDEVLRLKVEEHNFFVNENSFYVCKIGTGNQFAGVAPGAIEIFPGEKPNADLDNIWGGGFQEIREFISGMDTAKRWAPLFLSTSPSGSTDKNNVLLVGPQGCGKTQVMRALGASNESISIFSVGSDFITCWANESQKNPKRLFDEAVKLHKSSGRNVHILIDEIDMILNNDRTSGTRVNLSLEFQNLMDGVVAYPGISIWGATNHPKRIPTPMLRRFAKVLVVGELDEVSRVTILKHYLEQFLPCGDGFTDEQYQAWASRFDGATGDVLRKAVDEVWLRFMRAYISEYEQGAESILDFLAEQYVGGFEVSELTSEDRATVRNMIGETSTVTSELVDECISHLLDNFAVQEQIKVAKDTYRNAALLLERQKNDKGLGF